MLYLQSPLLDIRHNALSLLLPLLSAPAFLSGSKPLLPAIFSNLKEDPPTTVTRVLSALFSATTSSSIAAVNRRTASTLITEATVDGIVKLYNREGEDDSVMTGTNGTGEKTTVAEVAHQFLLSVCTRRGTGICFPDLGWYKRKGKGVEAEDEIDAVGGGGAEDGGDIRGGFLHNRTLNNVVRRLGPRVADDARVAVLVEGILGACPELVAR